MGITIQQDVAELLGPLCFESLLLFRGRLTALCGLAVSITV